MIRTVRDRGHCDKACEDAMIYVGVRHSGKPAGADEEGPHKIGGGRMSDLLAALATELGAVDVQCVLHDESLQRLHSGI